jgi:hypothetical protein
MSKVLDLDYLSSALGLTFACTAVFSRFYSTGSGVYPYIGLALPCVAMAIGFGVFGTIGFFARDFWKKRNSTLEKPIINQNAPISTPLPVKPKPPCNRESRMERQVHIVKRYFRYAVKCKYCGAIYNGQLTECPKCSKISSKELLY